MERHLKTVLNYFRYFSYAPSFGEIYTFFPQRITKKNLRSLLISSHYTLPQYSIHKEESSNLKFKIFNNKIVVTIQTYISFLKWCPFVRFVGVTGASAMMGPRKSDDLDLCIVTKRNLLWTTRFFVVALAKMLGIHSGTGVCLNLFFDESDLVILKKKHNSYIAHELLQMKPVIDKDCVYRRFLTENQWIYMFFPNAQSRNAKRETQNVQTNHVTRYTLDEHVERLFKSIQLPIIIRNKTAFSITSTQLWLFKNDFEKKLKRRGLVI